MKVNNFYVINVNKIERLTKEVGIARDVDMIYVLIVILFLQQM